MNKDGVHHFFTVVSRLIPGVVIVAVLLGVSLRYHVFESPPVSVNPQRILPSPRTKSVSDIFGGAGKISGLDPAKDFSCLYSDKTASISAHKKGRDIIIRHATLLEKKHYLITGDCLYVWKDGTFEGRKICGIGNRIVLIQTILSAGILNAESLTKMLPENLPIPSGGVLPVGQIQKFLKSCINREINNSDIPAVPKNITFSEAKK